MKVIHDKTAIKDDLGRVAIDPKGNKEGKYAPPPIQSDQICCIVSFDRSTHTVCIFCLFNKVVFMIIKIK